MFSFKCKPQLLENFCFEVRGLIPPEILTIHIGFEGCLDKGRKLPQSVNTENSNIISKCIHLFVARSNQILRFRVKFRPIAEGDGSKFDHNAGRAASSIVLKISHIHFSLKYAILSKISLIIH